MLESHAVVEITAQGHTRLVDPVKQVALVITVGSEDAFLDPGHQDLLFKVGELREEFVFTDHVRQLLSYAGFADAFFLIRP
jgi:hypothetical protein